MNPDLKLLYAIMLCSGSVRVYDSKYGRSINWFSRGRTNCVSGILKVVDFLRRYSNILHAPDEYNLVYSKE